MYHILYPLHVLYLKIVLEEESGGYFWMEKKNGCVEEQWS